MGQVTLQRDGPVARITLDDPERLNAMSVSMWTALADAVAAVDADHAMRVVVLRGAGDRAFVSGANISEFGTLRNSPEATRAYDAAVAGAQGALQRCRVPVIAAISGVCYGGGLGLALSCDLRHASPSARFRMPAARLGLGYAYDNVRTLLAQLGPLAAAEAFYTARVYDAQGAARIGIVGSVVDDVFAHCEALAAEIAANAPLTVQAGKLALRAALAGSTQLDAVHEAIAACFRSSDYAEGRLAFAEKRPPQFTGR